MNGTVNVFWFFEARQRQYAAGLPRTFDQHNPLCDATLLQPTMKQEQDVTSTNHCRCLTSTTICGLKAV